MADPFVITGPTCLSFSGGRTSAFMLWRVLQANTPEDIARWLVVCFANTGKEEEATLRFVRDVGSHWSIPIAWIEYQDVGYALVDFDTASRQGEPFAALIRKRQYLPNPVTRFCTVELKIRAMARHLVAIGMAETMAEGETMSMIGIRADEPRRAAKIADKSRIPLWTAGVTSGEVVDFWQRQAFNLELLSVRGRTLAGNCDLCFLKPAGQIASLISEKPERAVWWASMEAMAMAMASKPSGALFRSDRPSYAAMAKTADTQGDLYGHDDEEALACFCGE